MAKKRVKVGKYKTVFKGVIFKIKQAKAVFPSGKITTFEQVARPPTVTILAIDAKGRLLLTKEYRLKHRKYLWRLPSGRVEKNETPLQAARRELQEEAGLKAKKLKLFHVRGSSQTLDWKLYCYIATDFTPAPTKSDEDEDIKIVPTSIKKAFKMVANGEIKKENMAYVIMKLHFSKKLNKNRPF